MGMAVLWVVPDARALTIVTNETVTTDGQPFHGGDLVYVGGSLVLEGAEGSLVGSETQIVLRVGSRLVFDDLQGGYHTTHYSGVSSDQRWGDGQPITLRSGEIFVQSGNSANSYMKLNHEDVGEVSIAGGCEINLNGYKSGAAVLLSEGITRIERGCMRVQALDPTNADKDLRRRVCLDSGGTLGDSKGMLPPWLCAGSYEVLGLEGYFLSYDSTTNDIGSGPIGPFPGQPQTAVGLRSVAWDRTSLAPVIGSVTTDIVDSTVDATVNADTTVHALRIRNNGKITVSSDKTLTISSGGLILLGKNQHVYGSGTIGFGGAEGIVFFVERTSGGMSNGSRFEPGLSGTGGATFWYVCDNPHEGLQLRGDSGGLSGPITVHCENGRVRAQHANALPNGQDLRVTGGGLLDLEDMSSLAVQDLAGGGRISDSDGTNELSVSGDIAPGDQGTGTLTLQNVNLNLQPGCSLTVELMATNDLPGITFDSVNVTGNVAGLSNCRVIVSPPDGLDPIDFFQKEYKIISCSNDLSGQKALRVERPPGWVARCIGVDGGALLQFHPGGTVLTIL